LRSGVPGESDSLSLANLIITSVAAVALSGFGLLFLGFARFLNHLESWSHSMSPNVRWKITGRDRTLIKSRFNRVSTKFLEI